MLARWLSCCPSADTCPAVCCCAGYICCNPDREDNSCPDESRFNVVAWVTTKGFAALPYPAQLRNDGAVLLVEPMPGASSVTPDPLVRETFNGVTIPPLNITTSGYGCADDRFEGCSAANGLDDKCAVLLGYTLPDAEPILNTNNDNGDILIYTGSSCGGHSGGPLSAPDDGVAGFGILVAGPTDDCSLPGQTSGSTYSQIVDQVQEYGVYVEGLIDVLLTRRTRRASPSKIRPPKHAKGPNAHSPKKAKAPKKMAQPPKQAKAPKVLSPKHASR